MYTTVAEITPFEARDILDTKNFNNRPISEWTVQRYAQEMKAGRWKLNGESVIFDEAGRLLDGQHRLKACVLANVAFRTVVVKGAQQETFDTIDDGKVRSMSDVLGIRGEVAPNDLASGLRFIWDYGTGAFLSKSGGTRVIGTKQLMEKLLDKHRGIKTSAKMYRMLAKRTGGILLSPSLVVGLHYLFSLIDSEKADHFFSSLQSGLDMKEGNPVLALRAKLIMHVREESSKLIRREALYAYTVIAWNAYVKNQQLKKINWTMQQDLPEIVDIPQNLMRDLL